MTSVILVGIGLRLVTISSIVSPQIGADNYTGGTSSPPTDPRGCSARPPDFPGDQFHCSTCPNSCPHRLAILENYKYWWVWDKDSFIIDNLDPDDQWFFTSTFDFGKALNQPDTYSPSGLWHISARWVKECTPKIQSHACGQVINRYTVNYKWELDVESVTLSGGMTSEMGMEQHGEMSDEIGASVSLPMGGGKGGGGGGKEGVGVSHTIGVGWNGGFSFRSSVSSGGTSSMKPAWVKTTSGPANPGSNGRPEFVPCQCGKDDGSPGGSSLVPPRVMGPILDNADEFGIAVTKVPMHPDAKTVTVTFAAPADAGDEFGDGTFDVAVVTTNPTNSNLPADAIKTQTGSGKPPEFTVNVNDLMKQGVSGILAAFVPKGGKPKDGTPTPAQYVQFASTAGPANNPAAQNGITSVRAPNGTGAPNLMTDPTGRTANVAIDGLAGDSRIAIGERTESGATPISTFTPSATYTQRDEGGTILAKTTVGSFQGDPKKMNDANRRNLVIGTLATDGQTFDAGSVQNLNDLVQGGLPASNFNRLTPTIAANPPSVKVGQTFNVTATLSADAMRNYAQANGLPYDVVASNLEVVILHDDQEIKSGPSPLTVQQTAETADSVMHYKATPRYANRSAMPAALDDYQANALKQTEQARRALSESMSRLLETNARLHWDAARRRFTDR